MYFSSHLYKDAYVYIYFGMNTVFCSKYNFEKAAIYCKWGNFKDKLGKSR